MKTSQHHSLDVSSTRTSTWNRGLVIKSITSQCTPTTPRYPSHPQGGDVQIKMTSLGGVTDFTVLITDWNKPNSETLFATSSRALRDWFVGWGGWVGLGWVGMGGVRVRPEHIPGMWEEWGSRPVRRTAAGKVGLDKKSTENNDFNMASPQSEKSPRLSKFHTTPYLQNLNIGGGEPPPDSILLPLPPSSGQNLDHLNYLPSLEVQSLLVLVPAERVQTSAVRSGHPRVPSVPLQLSGQSEANSPCAPQHFQRTESEEPGPTGPWTGSSRPAASVRSPHLSSLTLGSATPVCPQNCVWGSQPAYKATGSKTAVKRKMGFNAFKVKAQVFSPFQFYVKKIIKTGTKFDVWFLDHLFMLSISFLTLTF